MARVHNLASGAALALVLDFSDSSGCSAGFESCSGDSWGSCEVWERTRKEEQLHVVELFET